jgi:cytidine deaminase
MQKKEYHFSYEVYETAAELTAADAELLDKARKVTENAYAPYSHFRVGAAARLNNGQIVTGTNQENASFPVGICAERVLLSTAASLYPGHAIESMAVSYFNEVGASDRPISPCGICRQSLQEFAQRTNQSIRLILSGQEGNVFIFPQADMLLPFAFSDDEL